MWITPRKRLRQLAGLAETANLLFLRLLWRHPEQAREYPGVMYREYLARARQDIWRAASIFELFPEIGEDPPRIVIEHLPGGSVHSPIEELAYLALATRALAPSMVFEIGTFRGRTALNFALNSPDSCRVLTLDLPLDYDEDGGLGSADTALVQRREVGIDYSHKDAAHKIEQLFGDSRRFDFSLYENKVDLVFVDGGHSYEIARSDTENALRLCRPGGAVIWHDFGNYGDYAEVIRAVLDCVPADQVYQIESSQLAVYRKR